ncbi:hypothetical protein [Thalassotalea eurytherma]|uniref:Lipoprotein n=1 Tax=Thalassotalea eurytherma TaxID=1144278 RepID=A0ABQ6H2E2_9GAMM|nr:hypothetical protein [Thalassotalea eurytherma]GLX81046.1 hypothetical protein theurythT_04980 [Thalassotalea eurytherma]
MKSSLGSLLTLAGITVLSGCGGGGSSSPSTPPIVTPGPTLDEITIIDESININQSVELFLLPPNANLTPTNINWQQVSGEPLPILSATAPLISVLPQQAGSYEFQVSFTSEGQSQTLIRTFNVSSDNARVSIHSGHNVVEGNKVSLRAAISDDIDENALSWQQIQGPTATLEVGDTVDNRVIYFDAPSVTQDTLISFQVTDANSGESDIVAVLVEDKPSIANNAYFDDPVATVFPYNANTPYANSIVGCVYSTQLTSSCTLGTLPLLAQDTTAPSVDDIMDRVVVSHRWMGDRFKSFLENHDPNDDFKNLLRATTAVVLSYDVRPSFYWAATGAIYLDPENLWLTAQERDTINEAPDYRSSFGQELQFIMPWRYVRDNDYAYIRQSRELRADRDIEAGKHRLTSLLYHELAHANDFFPPAEWQSHSASTRILDAAQATNWESDKLTATYPLDSQVMRDLAQVSFRGESASVVQRAYSPTEIGNIFSSDAATDYYNYSSTREDLAMLFEELMMQSRYGIRRDVAVTNLPQGDSISVTDYIVSWGQRGRVAESGISLRAEYVTERILPEFDVQAAIDSLPTPIPMVVGDDWLENLTISPTPSPMFINSVDNVKPTIHQHGAIEILPYGHKALPEK